MPIKELEDKDEICPSVLLEDIDGESEKLNVSTDSEDLRE
jgi:hypothetical protein